MPLPSLPRDNPTQPLSVVNWRYHLRIMTIAMVDRAVV
jgi:hypothetical protein